MNFRLRHDGACASLRKSGKMHLRNVITASEQKKYSSEAEIYNLFDCWCCFIWNGWI